MSESPKTNAKPGKGRRILLITCGAALLLAAGAGGSMMLIRSGLIGTGHANAVVDNRPRLVRKGEEDPYAPPSDAKEAPAPAEPASAGGSAYRTAYFSFSDEFTSNLKNSDSLVQVALACSTQRDGRVLIWLRKHELAIRSALLAVLSDTDENEATTVDGKRRMQKRLTHAINRVLTQTEGFGGVDAVYFRNYIIQ